MTHFINKTVVGLAVAVVTALGAAPLVHADTVPGASPAAADVVGVGSDTTQDVVDALATAWNAQTPAPAFQIYDYDATPVGSSIAVHNGNSILRPNGTGAGLKALLNDTAGNLDFARAARAKKTDGTEDALAFFAFGQDGSTWVSQATSYAPTSLTRNQLAGIYSGAYQYWSQVGGRDKVTVTKTTKWVWKLVYNKKLHKKVRTHVKVVTTKTTVTKEAIKAYLPDANSVIHTNFLAALGLTDSQVGANVTVGIEQNNGTLLGANNPNAIEPYSIGKWIAQALHHHNDVHGTTVLHPIDGLQPLVGTGADTRLNLEFNSQFLRVVFNVVKKISGTSTVNPKYLTLFGSGGFVCSQPAIIKDYGFLPLGGACGLQS